MKYLQKEVLLVAIMCAVMFMVFAVVTGRAGSLESNAPPGPTMKTLDQISGQISAVSSPINRVVRGVI